LRAASWKLRSSDTRRPMQVKSTAMRGTRALPPGFTAPAPAELAFDLPTATFCQLPAPPLGSHRKAKHGTGQAERCSSRSRRFAPSPSPADLRLPPGPPQRHTVSRSEGSVRHPPGVSVEISGRWAAWHGQTCLPVGFRMVRGLRSSTVKQVWRCHPTFEHVHRHLRAGIKPFALTFASDGRTLWCLTDKSARSRDRFRDYGLPVR
jgi:hypothetical protein